MGLENSIAAIYGFLGDLFETWTCPDAHIIWIRDFLKGIFPCARIFTFGYRVSELFLSTRIIKIEDVAKDVLVRLEKELRHTRPEVSVSMLQATFNPSWFTDNFKRPIIFICHSLGGIILKKAMISANNRRELHNFILERPKAVAFMGTPHLGSKTATWVDRFTRLPLPVSILNKDVVKRLKQDSRYLLELNRRSVERMNEFRAIVSFYERQFHPVSRQIVCTTS